MNAAISEEAKEVVLASDSRHEFGTLCKIRNVHNVPLYYWTNRLQLPSAGM